MRAVIPRVIHVLILCHPVVTEFSAKSCSGQPVALIHKGAQHGVKPHPQPGGLHRGRC